MSLTRGSLLPSLSTNRGLEKFLIFTLDVPKFRGVFACDLIPVMKCGETVILNTDPSSLPGKHYVCLRKVSAENYELYDSLSVNIPIVFPRLTEELKRRGIYKKLTYINKRPIQHLTSHTCGFFCVDFTLRKAYSEYRDMSQEFKSNTRLNDYIVIKNILRWVELCINRRRFK